MEEDEFIENALSLYNSNTEETVDTSKVVYEDPYSENHIFETNPFIFDDEVDELEETVFKAFGEEGLRTYKNMKHKSKGVSTDKDEIRKSLYNTMLNEALSFGVSGETADRIVKGMIANFAIESNFDTNAEGDKDLVDHAFGLGQWRKDRKDYIYGIASKYKDPLEGQGRASIRELFLREKRALNNVLKARNNKEAAFILRRDYERPHKSNYNEDRLYAELDRLSSFSYKQIGGINVSPMERRGYTNIVNYKPTANISPVENVYSSLDDQRALRRFSNYQKLLNSLDNVSWDGVGNVANFTLDKVNNISDLINRNKSILGYRISGGLSAVEGILNGIDNRKRTSDILEQMYQEDTGDYKPLLYQRTREYNVLN